MLEWFKDMPTHADTSKKYNFKKREILDLLAKEFKITSPQLSLIKSGLINTSIKVSSAKEGKYLLRVYKDQPEAKILRELLFMEKMSRNQIPVPKIFLSRTKSKIIKFMDDSGIKRKAVLFEFKRGKHISASQLNMIQEVANIHARMHKATGKLTPASKGVRNAILWLKDEHDSAQYKLKSLPAQKQKLDVIFSSVIKKFQKLPVLPQGLAHLDFDSSNILVTGQKVTGIIDFDDLDQVPFIMDLGYSIWWWVFNNNIVNLEKIINNYTSAYQNVRPLSSKERESLRLFISLRNITLAYLLFVNLPKRPIVAKLNKAISLNNQINR